MSEWDNCLDKNICQLSFRSTEEALKHEERAAAFVGPPPVGRLLRSPARSLTGPSHRLGSAASRSSTASERAVVLLDEPAVSVGDLVRAVERGGTIGFSFDLAA